MKVMMINPYEDGDVNAAREGKGLLGTPPLNFMFASDRCRDVIVKQFGRMEKVVFEKGRAFFSGKNLLQGKSAGGFDGPFAVSPWFVAYLIQCGQLHVTKVVLMYELEEGAVVVKKTYERELGDVDEVAALDALCYLLEFDDEEPGLSGCQSVDLRLVGCVFQFGDRISELDWLLALRSKTCAIILLQSFPAATGGGSRARFPDTTEISIVAHSHNDAESDLGNYDARTRLLSHLIDACPNLEKLDVLFALEDNGDISSLDAMANFRDCVFPHLPEGTKAAVRVEFCLCMEREEFEQYIREHGEAIDRDFDEETPHGQHIFEAMFDNTYLSRAMRWERGEGMEPWWVVLKIGGA